MALRLVQTRANRAEGGEIAFMEEGPLDCS